MWNLGWEQCLRPWAKVLQLRASVLGGVYIKFSIHKTFPLGASALPDSLRRLRLWVKGLWELSPKPRPLKAPKLKV